MASADDEIDKAVNIIIATKGTKEATKAVSDMHDTAHKGATQLQRDSTKSAEATDLFTRKWKNELLMIGGALGALYGLTKYSPVAASMLDVLGASLGYLATVILLPMLPYMLQFVGYIIDLADAFTKLDPTIQFIISALAALALGWGVLRMLPGFDLAKKIVFGTADLLKTMAGLGSMSAASFWAAFLVGLLLGFAVVWLLFKTGVLDKVAALGKEVQAKFPLIFDIITVITAPLALLGLVIDDIILAISKFLSGDTAGAIDQLVRIPSEVGKAWDKIKGILEGWGVPKGISDLAAALVTLADAIIMFKVLTKPIEAIKTVLGFGKKIVTGAVDLVTGAGGDGISTAATKASTTLPEAVVNGVASTAATAADAGVSTAANAAAGTVADTAASASTGVATTAADAAGSAATSAASTAATAATGAATAAAATGGIIDTVGSVLGKVAGIGSRLLPGLNVIAGLQMVGAIENGATTAESTPIPNELYNQTHPNGVPQYAAGGYVASDQIAQLHKGDWIRSKYGDTTKDSTGKTDKGSAGTTINGGITINTQSKNPEEIYRYVNQRLQQATRGRT